MERTNTLPVRGTALLPCKLKEVIPKENWHLVVLHKLAPLSMFTETAIEDVEGAVITGRLQILHVVLHFHLDRVAIVVLATLELLVAVFALESLQGPLVSGWPRVLAAQQNDGFIRFLKTLNELLWTETLGVHSLHVVLDKDRQAVFIFDEAFYTLHFTASLKKVLHKHLST